MGRRTVIQIRLSKNWVKSTEPTRMLANFLYSFYTFLGLDDPCAQIGWMILQNTKEKTPYLVVYEEGPELEAPEAEQLPPEPEPDPDPSDEGILSEADLNPDLV